MKQNTFRLLEEYMLANVGDAAHDGEHIRRVLYAALDIAGYEESVDYDVLIAACLLHDIARPVQMKDPSRKHAPEGADMAREFLLSNGFGAEFAGRVADCIRVHSSADASARGSLEAKILFDADKLDTAGALGVARILMCGAAYNEPLYARDAAGALQDGSADSGRSFFREYQSDFSRVAARLHTARARDLAAERMPAAEAFFRALLGEIRALDESGPRLLSDRIE